MSYSFSIYAGHINSGDTADDGITTAASFSTEGLSVYKHSVRAADGTIYFIDGYCIRKIYLTGEVVTIAGIFDTAGYVDDTGSAARFTGPSGIAVDANNNIYVTEITEYTIRKITPAGVVTTWIGAQGVQNTTEGTGTSARCFSPTALCFDGVNTLFLIDYFRVRKITISTAAIAALAGSVTGFSGETDGTGNAARFNIAGNQGGALWYQSARSVLVVLSPNNANTAFLIREVTLAGVVTTVAGTATITLGGGIMANSAITDSTTALFVNVNGHLFTLTRVSLLSYTVVDENIWSSHVGVGAAIRSNVVYFNTVLGIFGREFSAGGSNAPVFEASGTPINGLSVNPAGGLNIAGTATISEIVDLSGIYALDPTQTHDTYWDRANSPPTADLDFKIPNPTFKTGYLGG